MALKIKEMANVAGLAVAACCVVGGTVATGGGLLAALASGSLLLDCVLEDKRSDLQTSIDKVQKSYVEEVAQIALVHDVSQDELDEVSKALNDAVYHTGASHEDFAIWNYDPTIVAERMLERLCHHYDLFENSKFANALAKGVLFKAFTTVRETDGFQKKADIYFKTEALTKLDAIDIRTQTILEKLEKLEGGGQRAIDQDTEKSIKQTIRGLITAQEGARKRAGDKLEANPPDPDGAKIELRQLAAQQEDNVRDAAQTYMDIGNIAYMNDTHEALEAYTRVTELTPSDPVGWNFVGLLQQRLGDLGAAEMAYKKVLTIGKVQGDKMLQAVAAGNLGIVEQIRGNLAAAVDYHKKSLALSKELGRKQGMANQYGNLGIVERICGNLDAAVDYFQQALMLMEQLGSKAGMASSYGNLGNVEGIRGNLAAAVDYCQKSLALNKELGRKESMAKDYGNLGIIEKIRGNFDAAVAYHKKSLAIEKQLGRKEGMANDYANLGLVEQTQGNLDSACKLWRQAYDLFVEIGARPQVEQTAQLMRDAGCADVQDDGAD